jgi:predicted metal-binding membrane protein
MASAVTAAVRYALICIGCCWATMLLTVIVGAYALPLMVVVSAIMLAERTLPRVRPLIPLQASLAIVLGLLLLVQQIPVEVSLVAS